MSKRIYLKSRVNKIKKDLDSFFGIKLDPPKLSFLYSRKQMNKVRGHKTPSWLVGGYWGNEINIMHPSVYTKESDHKNPEHFWLTLKHEFVHYYFKQYTGIGYPKWLNEGLACYLAKQVKDKPSEKQALKVFEYFNKNDFKIYAIGYFWVNCLISKFGKKLLLKLLKSLREGLTERKFKENFYKVYKFNYSKKDFKTLAF